MSFAVLGAGAIGAYVGAALARGGSDVVLIARGAQLEALRKDGVRVLSPHGDFHVHPAATDEIEAIREADVVFVGLKAYSLPELAPRLAEALGPQTALVAAQNGIPWWYFQSHGGPLDGTALESVDPGGVIARSIEPERVIGCVIYCSTEIVSPGVIRHIEGTRFAIGEPDGSRSDRCVSISDAFVAGGLKCPVEERLRDQIWLKLIGNVAFNPVSALTGATLGELAAQPEMLALLRSLFEESAALADRLGIVLPVSLDRRLEAGIAVGDHKTSMLQDLEAAKPLELDCLTGAVIELADRLGVAVPHTHSVHACVKLLASLRGRATTPASR
jgi:2-dehydropantoate 2-reductase